MQQIAALYVDESMDSEEKNKRIQQKEFEAICNYMGRIEKSLGMLSGTPDVMIMAAAMKTQYEFVMKSFDEPARLYTEHLSNIVKHMSVEKIVVDLEELKRQLKENGIDFENPPENT